VKVDGYLIDIAPAPVPRPDDSYDWMMRVAKVLRGMLVLGIVAAADMAARSAYTELDPRLAAGETFLAARRVGTIGHHEVQVAALRRHEGLGYVGRGYVGRVTRFDEISVR